VAPAVAHRHLHEVHLLAEGDRLGPAVEDAPILAGVRSPPAVSNLGPVAGTVLGTVRKMESGAWRASSSIHSIPFASQTFPISWLSQKIVVVPLRSAASA
jgi:hypothetical protein